MNDNSRALFPLIEIRQLTKSYVRGKQVLEVLHGINLDIPEGDFVALMGPSGSGKTTLLNMLGGLDVPSEGFVEISGTNITALKGNKLIDFRLNNIGFVFQSYNLIPVLTSKENIEFIMLLQNRPKEETEQRVLELLKQIGLEDKINKRPKELSGGQQQRVAVARALAPKPQFILADEPTANLDSVSAENLLDMMLKLNQEENMTFIFSTHDQRVINRARRVITLEDGKIVADTAPTTIEHLQK